MMSTHTLRLQATKGQPLQPLPSLGVLLRRKLAQPDSEDHDPTLRLAIRKALARASGKAVTQQEVRP